MSSYPSLILPMGVGWDYKKSPRFSNITLMPQTAKHPATSTLQNGTIFGLEFVFKYLKQARAAAVFGNPSINDLQYLQEFFEACGGGFNWFTFDPYINNFEDTTITQDFTKLKNGFFAIGDGVTTVFPLWRSTVALGGGNISQLERIQNVVILNGIYANGTVIPGGDYTLTNFPATVTFGVAPVSGTILAWSGRFSYLCMFEEDSVDFNEFMFQLWELGSMKLQTINL